MEKKTILVKIGGKAAEREDGVAALCAEMAALSDRMRFVLVHGGGAEVTALSKRLGIETVFVNGLRQTSAEEMDIIDMVLAGKINKRLVRLLRTQGMDAVGISGCDGGIIGGRPVAGGRDGAESRTGEVTSIDARLLELLLTAGYLPVISSPSMDERGRGLNINADAAGFAIASRLRAEALVFLSDIPGILRDGAPIASLSTREAAGLIASGVVTGGMIPKVTASTEALDQGVRTVIIGQYEGAGSLARLLEGRQGTRIGKGEQ